MLGSSAMKSVLCAHPACDPKRSCRAASTLWLCALLGFLPAQQPSASDELAVLTLSMLPLQPAG